MHNNTILQIQLCLSKKTSVVCRKTLSLCVTQLTISKTLCKLHLLFSFLCDPLGQGCYKKLSSASIISAGGCWQSQRKRKNADIILILLTFRKVNKFIKKILNSLFGHMMRVYFIVSTQYNL